MNALQTVIDETGVVGKNPRYCCGCYSWSQGKKDRGTERLLAFARKFQENQPRFATQLDYADALEKMGIDPGALKKAQLARMVFGRCGGIGF